MFILASYDDTYDCGFLYTSIARNEIHIFGPVECRHLLVCLPSYFPGEVTMSCPYKYRRET